MGHEAIQGQSAPIGPYSAAVRTGNSLYISGQLPMRYDGAIEMEMNAAAALALENMRALLINGGFAMTDVVKTTVYLTDIAQFGVFNEVYARYFSAPFPARTTVEVRGLPKNAPLEIDAIAIRG